MLGGFCEFTIRDHATAEVCLIFDDIIIVFSINYLSQFHINIKAEKVSLYFYVNQNVKQAEMLN